MIPRNEYPRPQLVRQEWLNLNGPWDYTEDNAMNGRELAYYKKDSFDRTITVPFCPESVLSGIGDVDFKTCVWYRKAIDIPADWSGKRVILHFGAVDYLATVWVNGNYVGNHKGGFTPFSFDITDYLVKDGNYITLSAYDDVRHGNQPIGKQCQGYYSAGCSYTRTTGIWQTVWMEPVNPAHIEKIKIKTTIEPARADITLTLSKEAIGKTVTATAAYEGKEVGKASVTVNGMTATISLPLSETHLWEVGQGRLYDLSIDLEKDDSVTSYFGLREVTLGKRAFLLNGKSVFGRWVLDQGFYPDGIFTAPSDEALKNDILYSQKLGFNGARLHQKIFEPRFLYWADRLGYLVWGEHGNWGLRIHEGESVYNFLPEWMESVERDYSHPSIIGWCPFNETWDHNGHRQDDRILKLVYDMTKAADDTRPVIDTSGNFHVKTDIFDIHEYDQNPVTFKEHLGSGIFVTFRDRQRYEDQPFFVSEYGGIKWSERDDGWGYGDAPKTEEEFLARYQALTETLLDNPECCAFCYTQLYDIEQEQNGLLTYDRKFKFDPEIIYAINTKKAAIED